MRPLNVAIREREKALQDRRDVFERTHPDTLQSMEALAIAYSDAGRLGEPLSLLQECLDIRERTLSPNDPDVLRTMRLLASAFVRIGKTGEAAEMADNCVEIAKIRFGPETLSSMLHLSSIYKEIGREAEWLQVAEECLDMATEQCGMEDTQTLVCLDKFAFGYEQVGRFQKSLVLRSEALDTREKVLGARHPRFM